jgi:hypothetical protein
MLAMADGAVMLLAGRAPLISERRKRTLISRLYCLVSFLLAVGFAGPAFSYDATWYKVKGWSGEYPHGFTMAANVTINVRASLSLDAPKSISCDLKKGSTYHPWNKKRVLSDRLEFVSFTKVERYELKESVTVDVERQSDRRNTTIEFKKGDRWSYLFYIAEGTFLINFGDTIYVAGQDLYERSTEVEPPVNRDQSAYDEWLYLKCANGTFGWIFFNEIENAPGFSKANIIEYGIAGDLQSQPKSPSGSVILRRRHDPSRKSEHFSLN